MRYPEGYGLYGLAHVSDESGDVAEAWRLLDERLASVPAAHHAAMLTNLRVHREILAAWRVEFGDDDEPHGTESLARAGLT